MNRPPTTSRARLLAALVLAAGACPGGGAPALASGLSAGHGAASIAPRGSVASPGSVRLLQRRLRLPADGIFGAHTASAVERFQAGHGLTPDGVVGAQTWAALGVSGRHPVLAAVDQAPAHPAPAAPAPAAPAPGRLAPTHQASARPSAGVLAGAAVAPGSPGSPASTRAPPERISLALAAADRIAELPYIWGGGHAAWDAAGYDCSGSVSYVLHAADALSAPEDSSDFETYGAPGPGTWITIYARADHVFMTIGDRRFDTSGAAAAGSRWQPLEPAPAGYVVRHPIGL
ncbi:MAG TPA: peptidoglycan-binding protein [Solirubrobacteraceae bacterium]